MIALLASVAAASALGSLHCVGMCGPFATFAGTRPARVRLPQVGAIGSAAAYNAGRLLLYVTMGAAAGLVGMAVDGSGTWVGLSRLGTGLAGLTLVVVGLLGFIRAAGGRVPGSGTEIGAFRVLSRVLSAAGALPPRRRALVLGALTALMPCGWLWAFVVTAAGTGSPGGGAAVMAAFWAGTVPALVAVGAGAHLLTTRLRAGLPWLMPAALTVVGAYMLFVRAPLPIADHGDAAPTASPTPSVPSSAPCH